MDELTMVRRYGPAATPPSEDALAAARARLLEEIGGQPVVPRGVRADRQPLRLRRAAILVAAAAAMTIGMLGLRASSAPAPEHQAAAPVSAITIASFPLSLDPLPNDLAQATISAPSGILTARYTSRYGGDVVISVSDSAEFDPAGSNDPGGASTVVERAPGQWVRIVTYGSRANALSSSAIAAALTDDPQNPPVHIALVPDGWAWIEYDRTSIRLGNSAGSALNARIVVTLAALSSSDMRGSVAGGSVVDGPMAIKIGGHAALIADAGSQVLVQITLPDGRPCVVSAPTDLPRNQVFQIAASITA